MKLIKAVSIACLLNAVHVFASPGRKDTASDYDPSENILNVHIVPHTHDDVGWLKTVEQYYYGQNNTIRHACVSCILDSLIPALQQNPERKFTYVEMAFFAMWWEEQGTAIRNATRELVQNGQLAFVNGGWCMHDEATTHFMGMIDQTTLGHDFLKKEFDYIPSIGWQLDPFGHSATQASLLSREAGFNALYFGRIDYQDLQNRWEKKNCEGIWDSAEEPDPIFWGLTGSFGGNYGAPEGFCFDILCDDDPLYGMTKDNLHYRMVEFLKLVRIQMERSRGNNIMLTMGSDFQFENAIVNFKSLDLLINQINSMGDISKIFPELEGVRAFYSNPEIYTEYKHKEYTYEKKRNGSENFARIYKNDDSIANLETKRDDFFPYSDCDHCFWTGYFTSRPALKLLEREGSSFLQVARQIQSLSQSEQTLNRGSNGMEAINKLEKGVAIAQHHDGVSGTSKQHVAFDYAKKIQAGINEASEYVSSVLKSMIQGEVEADVKDIQYCQLRNESICVISQGETTSNTINFYVALYNALGWKRSDIVSLPVSSNATYEVLRNKSGDWETMEWSVVPNPNYANIEGASDFNLLIYVPDMNPLSVDFLWIRNTKADDVKSTPRSEKEAKRDVWREGVSSKTSRYLRNEGSEKMASTDPDIVIKHKDFDVNFKSGSLSSVVINNVEIGLVSEWGFYKSWAQQNTQNSGAYIFRPDKSDAKLQKLHPVPSKTHVVQTELVTEVHSSFEGSFVHQIIKVYKDKAYFDVEYTVGPIPVNDGVGKEVVHLLRSNIVSNGTFYTDSNARQFFERKRSQRQTWNMSEFEPVAGNYYPVNAAIFIQDDSSAMAVCTDRTQGGSSLEDGNIELMVHRRLVEDDARGVGEILNETTAILPYPPFGDASRQGDGLIISGLHRILVGQNVTGARLARTEMDNMFSPTRVFPFNSTGKVCFKKENELSLYNSLNELPENVQLLTLKLLKAEGDGRKIILLRLGHAYGKKDCKKNGVSVRLDISKLFRHHELVSFDEKTLTANQDKDLWNSEKMLWGEIDPNALLPQNAITLNPMEVKTFEITIVCKS